MVKDHSMLVNILLMAESEKSVQAVIEMNIISHEELFLVGNAILFISVVYIMRPMCYAYHVASEFIIILHFSFC